jgi:hypothetical protein
VIAVKLETKDISARWRKRASTATTEAVEAWEKWIQKGAEDKFEHKFNKKIWSAFKEWLGKHKFHNKCAYCEELFVGSFSAAEHYRPKASVSKGDGSNDRPACSIPSGSAELRSVEHPGYFWLAYNWRNLLPACSRCNSGLQGEKGKGDQFPVVKSHILVIRLTEEEYAKLKDECIKSTLWPGWYYLGPLDLDEHEEPLLLNPLNMTKDERREHILFGKKGIASGLTREGEATIRICRLDNERLRQARQTAQEHIHARYYGGYADPLQTITTETVTSRIQPYLDGTAEYSAAALDYIELLEEERASIRPNVWKARAGRP